jgi:hypothetical protein
MLNSNENKKRKVADADQQSTRRHIEELVLGLATTKSAKVKLAITKLKDSRNVFKLLQEELKVAQLTANLKQKNDLEQLSTVSTVSTEPTDSVQPLPPTEPIEPLHPIVPASDTCSTVPPQTPVSETLQTSSSTTPETPENSISGIHGTPETPVKGVRTTASLTCL